MNSELKDQILESLLDGLTNSRELYTITTSGMDCRQYQEDIAGIRATISAVEAEPDPTQKLTADQIESCFPDGGDTNENGVTVSAQWLHDFARNVESKISVTPVRVWNERDVEIVRATMEVCMHILNKGSAGTCYDVAWASLEKCYVEIESINPQTILDSLKGK